MKRSIWIAVFSLLTHYICAQSDDSVLVRINGKGILCSEFISFCENNLPAKSNAAQVKHALETFVNNKLKIDEAEKLQIDKEANVCNKLIELKQALLKKHSSIERVVSEMPKTPLRKLEVVHVEYIYKHLPQSISVSKQNETIRLIDSLYYMINNQSAANFRQYVEKYSDDKSSLRLNALQMTEEFAGVVFSLKQGEISKPFLSHNGVYIVKLLAKEYVETGNKIARGKSNAQLIASLKNSFDYRANDEGMAELLKLSRTNKPLFYLGGKEYTGTDFATFANRKFKKPKDLLDDFVLKSLLDYESDILTPHSLPYKRTFQVTRDSILLKEITNKEIISQSNDNTGLRIYFDTHKKKYSWKKPRYRGIVLQCVDEEIARRAKKLIKKQPNEKWEEIINKQFNADREKPIIQMKQGLFAEGDDPYIDKFIFKKGEYIFLKDFPYTTVVGKKTKKPVRYEEVLDLLIIDYQNFLESLWITRLHAGNKVEINQEVLKTVNNNLKK
ncbi:peptidylprolyl isomerase [Bacteroides sp. 224]|uniref:peptidylprolyl isomerase n=1 Tax=Bacteroides sp. 224 TaxID=2302936 RepID=UPI0013D6D523|nr:peptidylprolyl isomerase [Bacteroides sp. 224]NDV64565.1 hypothetical protein [Bacteroides sp. 224]